MTRNLDPGTRIKAEFEDDHATTGGFTLTACHNSVEASIESPQFHPNDNNPGSQLVMYDYNLYIERGTFSPEPQILIRDLQPMQAVQWTLKLVIRDDDVDWLRSSAKPPQQKGQNAEPTQQTSWWTNLRGVGLVSLWKPSFWSSSLEISSLDDLANDSATATVGLVAICTLVFVVAVLLQRSWTRQRRRRGYEDLHG